MSVSMSRPARLRGQAHQYGVDVAAGSKTEGRSAIVDQVELGIAAAPFELARLVRLVERRVHPPPNQPRKDVEQGLADVAGEGEARLERRLEMIVEYASDAAMDSAMGYVEIFVGPFAEPVVEGLVVRRAGGSKTSVELGRILPIGDRRVEIGAAAEPAPGGRQEAGVHVNRRNVRIGHMGNQ